jgi:ankyrin repeat protein
MYVGGGGGRGGRGRVDCNRSRNILLVAPLPVSSKQGNEQVERKRLYCVILPFPPRPTLPRTPLHAAVEGGKVECARFLLKNSADTNAIDGDGTFLVS